MRARAPLALALTTWLALLSAPSRALADEHEEPPPAEEHLSVHYQAVAETQAHGGFRSKYSGANSLDDRAESATAALSTLFVDASPWRGTELVFDPEMSGGKGLSLTRGVAAFPSGIVYRVGDPSPAIYLARLLLRQTFGLGGGTVAVESGPNAVAGTRDRDTLTFSVGRLAVTDVFDGNAYAHDPGSQFFDWALFASGAWDYPADTRGYTWGALGDLSVDWWSARAGIALEPKYANLTPMEWRVDKARGLMAEFEARHEIRGRKGATRLLVFLNQARMGSYQLELEHPLAYGNEVAATRADGRTKGGFALSADQELTRTLGAFVRLSWNDGANETWAFAEIDQSAALGLVQHGAPWCREHDEMGAALVLDGISAQHRRYLASGGTGFMLGDGGLRYGVEVIGDLYYRARITENIELSAIYQPIVNPGYNRDRGPVNVFSGRLRVAF